MAGTTQQDIRQTILRSALSMVGNLAGDTVDTILAKVDAELAKLFENNNVDLVGGGVVSYSSDGATLSFTENLKLHLNSTVAGGDPVWVDLSSASRSIASSGSMVYAVVDRTAVNTQTVTITIAAPGVVTLASHGFTVGQPVYFTTTGSLPGGLTPSTTYYVSSVTTNTFTVSATLGGSSIATTGTQSGTQSVNWLGSAVITDNASSLPAVSAANQEVFLIAKRADTANSNPILYLRGGLTVLPGQSSRLGQVVAQSSSDDSVTTGTNATLQSFTTGIVRLTNASLSSVSGIPAGISNQVVVVENHTGNAITINNDDSNASVGNKIYTGSGGSVSMQSNGTFVFTYDTTSAHWMLTGGSGSGGGSGTGKNYLAAIQTSQSSTPNTGNGNFELGSTTGWSVCNTTLNASLFPSAVATAGTPFSSTAGGTAAVSLSLGLVTGAGNAIAGKYSGSIGATGVSTPGDMLISDAFSIDAEDQATPLQWSFQYLVASGILNQSGTSSNSYAVYIYDVENAQWIQPAGVYGITGSPEVTGTFQTAKYTSSSSPMRYQIALVNINAIAAAHTVYVDDFSVGPQIIVQGAPITDWQSYIPTFTGFGTVTNISFYSRRVGDSLEVHGTATAGAPTATLAQVTLGYNGGNANVIIDISKVSSSNQLVGNFGTNASASTSGPYSWGVLATGANNYVEFGAQLSNNASVVPQNGDVILVNAGATVNFYAKVPIAGWSSNVQMSSDTDTRVVAFNASGTFSGAISTTLTDLIYNISNEDTHGAYNTSTGFYTVPVSGYYFFSASYGTGNVAAGSTIVINIYKNGILVATRFVGEGTQSTGVQTTVTAPWNGYCNAGDQINIKGSSSISGNNYSGGVVAQQFFGNRLSGPSVIAATESVNMRYEDSSGASVSTEPTFSVFKYQTKVFDSHNAYDTSTGIYTVPVSGKYQVNGRITLTSNTTGFGSIISIYKNGTLFSRNYSPPYPNTGDNADVLLSDIVPVNTGDTIGIYVAVTGGTGSETVDAARNYLSICRVGN